MPLPNNLQNILDALFIQLDILNQETGNLKLSQCLNHYLYDNVYSTLITQVNKSALEQSIEIFIQDRDNCNRWLNNIGNLLLSLDGQLPPDLVAIRTGLYNNLAQNRNIIFNVICNCLQSFNIIEGYLEPIRGIFRLFEPGNFLINIENNPIYTSYINSLIKAGRLGEASILLLRGTLVSRDIHGIFLFNNITNIYNNVNITMNFLTNLRDFLDACVHVPALNNNLRQLCVNNKNATTFYLNQFLDESIGVIVDLMYRVSNQLAFSLNLIGYSIQQLENDINNLGLFEAIFGLITGIITFITSIRVP